VKERRPLEVQRALDARPPDADALRRDAGCRLRVRAQPVKESRADRPLRPPGGPLRRIVLALVGGGEIGLLAVRHARQKPPLRRGEPLSQAIREDLIEAHTKTLPFLQQENPSL